MATKQKDQTAEELAEGIRGAGGHLPTKSGEAARKRREKERNQKQGYVRENF